MREERSSVRVEEGNRRDGGSVGGCRMGDEGE